MEVLIKSVIVIVMVLLNLFLCFKIVKGIHKHCEKTTQTDGSCQCDKGPMVKLYLIIEAIVIALTIVLFNKFI